MGQTRTPGRAHSAQCSRRANWLSRRPGCGTRLQSVARNYHVARGPDSGNTRDVASDYLRGLSADPDDGGWCRSRYERSALARFPHRSTHAYIARTMREMRGARFLAPEAPSRPHRTPAALSLARVDRSTRPSTARRMFGGCQGWVLQVASMTESPPSLVFDRGTLLFLGAWPAEIASLPRVLLDPRVGSFRAPAFAWSEITGDLRDRRLDFEDRARSASSRPGAWRPVELRPYQETALRSWEIANRRGLVVLPTGSGKTRVALAAMARCGGAALRPITSGRTSATRPSRCRSRPRGSASARHRDARVPRRRASPS